MLISHYLIFKNNYFVPSFNYGMLCYVTISTSSRYVSMTGFMEKNKDDNELYSVVSFAAYQQIHVAYVLVIFFLNFHPFIYFDFLLRPRTSSGTPTAFWKTMSNQSLTSKLDGGGWFTSCPLGNNSGTQCVDHSPPSTAKVKQHWFYFHSALLTGIICVGICQHRPHLQPRHP
jgi:hypothetical protein